MSNKEQKATKNDRPEMAHLKYAAAMARYNEARMNYDQLLSELSKLNLNKSPGYYSISGIKIDIPFLASTDEKIKLMVKMLGDIKGKKVADLGCGDGKILIELIKKGAEVHGFELEPKLINEAKNRLIDYKQEYKIFCLNFFKADLSKYDALTIYGISSMMGRLENKLLSGMKKDAIVISNTFTFPNWRPMIAKDGVYLYVR